LHDDNVRWIFASSKDSNEGIVNVTVHVPVYISELEDNCDPSSPDWIVCKKKTSRVPTPTCRKKINSEELKHRNNLKNMTGQLPGASKKRNSLANQNYRPVLMRILRVVIFYEQDGCCAADRNR
jgi:hypothetical protein